MEYKWTALTVVTVGTMMAAIDGRILVIGLPTIAKQLQADAEQVIWISQAYILSSTACLLFIGRVADLYGRIKVYNIGFIIFTLGSALCALSFNSYELIAFRIFQGIGSGILVTNSSVIVTDAAPRSELGLLLGINQTAFRVGNMAGLTLSGLILSIVDWRGLFYVNIPIGIFGTIWAHKRLREIGTRDTSREMDWAGFASFSIALTLVLLSITFLSYGVSGSWQGYGFLVFGLIVMVAFFRIESKSPHPLLDLRLFKIKLFAMGNLAQVMNSVGWGGLTLLLAFYLQIAEKYTPLQSGLAILPLDATYLVSTLVSGKLSDRYGSRLLSTAGLGIVSACFLLMSTFGPSTSYVKLALILAVFGVGEGLFTAPNLVAIMGSVPVNRVGIASGFRNTMIQIGLTASFGLMVLFITFGIPYALFSQLLQGTLSGAGALLARDEFVNGFRIATLILAVLNMIAIVPSAMRGPRESRLEVEKISRD